MWYYDEDEKLEMARRYERLKDAMERAAKSEAPWKSPFKDAPKPQKG